jgi:hypothetical protein
MARTLVPKLVSRYVIEQTAQTGPLHAHPE